MKPDVRVSIQSLKDFANSFKGMETAAVRKQLKGAVIKSKKWSEGKFSGKGLVAIFPKCEVWILFYGKKVCMTSVQVLAD